jgi:hypothetical protein
MKNDILEILQQHKLGHIPENQALNELCILFSVVWRSEQLLTFYQYMEPENSKSEMTKHAISAYLKSE